MTTIWERTKTALTALGVPMAESVYLSATGAALPDLFMVYSLISSPPLQHADDAETMRQWRMQVNVYNRTRPIGGAGYNQRNDSGRVHPRTGARATVQPGDAALWPGPGICVYRIGETMPPISANSGEYKSKIGLDSLYVAEVTVDTVAAFTADTPEWLAPAAEASQEPSTNFDIQYADDQAYEVTSSEGETKITLTVTGMPIEMLAKITGRVFDATTGRMYDNAATPPYMALSFRSQKSNGKYRYYQFLKGKFDMPKEEIATLAETPEPKTLELTYTAIKTTHKFDLGDIDDSVKRIVGDEDTTNFSGASWFSQVQTPSVSTPSALALSSSDPADGASSVAVDKTITLTFNNALVATAIYGVTVVKADGTLVTCVNSLDTTLKIMTVNPSASLDASSTYIVAIGVMDIYGDTLNAAVNFGTAA